MMILKLNSEIFHLEKIDFTKQAFSEHADISVERKDEYWILSFSDCKYDETITVREFENYLIGLENS